jgi:hypothetical protein
MGAPKLDDEENLSRKQVRRSRWLIPLGIALGACLVASLLGSGFSRHPFACAVCWENRLDHSWFGLKWSQQEETTCSRWYESNVERTHAHYWVNRTHCRWVGIPGLYGGYSCTVGGPITGLSETVQIEIYKHFKDRLEAKQLFIQMVQTDYRPWSSLMEWVDQGYPGNWHDRWGQYLHAR